MTGGGLAPAGCAGWWAASANTSPVRAAEHWQSNSLQGSRAWAHAQSLVSPADAPAARAGTARVELACLAAATASFHTEWPEEQCTKPQELRAISMLAACQSSCQPSMRFLTATSSPPAAPPHCTYQQGPPFRPALCSPAANSIITLSDGAAGHQQEQEGHGTRSREGRHRPLKERLRQLLEKCVTVLN